MKYLYIYPIEGLYHEFFIPNPDDISDKIRIKNNTIKTNGYFWNNIFSHTQISKLIERLEIYSKSQSYLKPQHMAIMANKSYFLENVTNALVGICEAGNDMQKLFSNIETLNIAVDLYNTFSDVENRLTLQEGYLFDNYSYRKISDNCLINKRNPYLDIILNQVLPLVLDYKPELVFLNGRISYFNVAIAKLLKSVDPKIKICITRHSSEYFSLNKITNYLLKNNKLFSDIDFLILEYFEFSEKSLLDALKNRDIIETVPNVIYKSSDGEIKKTFSCSRTEDHKSKYIIRSHSKKKFNISSAEVVDVCFSPYSKCYWNKCTFCGINQKYSHDYCECKYYNYYESANILLKTFPNNRYFWFIDEALNDLQLKAISNSIIESKRTIYWQARTRIRETLLSDELIDTLARSGLKELRLGLESASYGILKKMNKFEDSFSLELVEQIAKKYTKKGISIHFPIIIGFPGESDYDRHQTYEFLENLIKNNPLISFNINILNLDISSTLFKKWYEFEMESVSLPCLPSDFIGNTANWTGVKCKTAILEDERNSFMREKLYPWFPVNSLTKPVVFYRLAESLRATLVNRSLKSNDTMVRDSYVLDINTVFYQYNRNCLAYNFRTHHYMRFNPKLLNVLYRFKIPHSIIEIKEYIGEELEEVTESDLNEIVKRLIADGYFTNDF